MPGEDQRHRPSRFATLRSVVSRAIRGGTNPTSAPSNGAQKPARAKDFRDAPMPDRDAPDTAFEEYRVAVNRLGAAVTTQDVAQFRDLTDDVNGQHVAVAMQRDAQATPGMRQLTQAFATQHPEVVERAGEQRVFSNYNIVDNQAELFPSRLQHLAPEIVTADSTDFARRLKTVNALPPLAGNPSAAQFKSTREAFESVGLRLTNYDKYVNQLVEEGEHALLKGEKVSLAVEALQELKLPQADRKLLNLGAQDFAEALRTRQPLPKERPPAEIDGTQPGLHTSRADDGEYLQTPGVDGRGRADSGTYLHSPLDEEELESDIYLRSPEPPSFVSPVIGTQLVGDRLAAADGGKLEQSQAEANRPRVTRGDAEYAVEPGYRQHGSLIGATRDRIFQRIGTGDNDVASYKLGDLDHGLAPHELDLALKEGHNSVFTVSDNGRIQMVDLDREKELSLAPQQTNTAEKSLKIGWPSHMEL